MFCSISWYGYTIIHFSIFLSVDSQFGCCKCLVVMNKDAVNICVLYGHIFLFLLSKEYLEVGLMTSLINIWLCVVSRLVLSDYLWPVDCSPPGSSLSIEFCRQEYWSWLLLPPLRGSSQPRNETQVSCVAGEFFIIWATREALNIWLTWKKLKVQNCFLKRLYHFSFPSTIGESIITLNSYQPLLLSL